MDTKKLTKAALLAGVALILFSVEAQIPPLTTVPGVKLGLANIVTVFAFYVVGPRGALAVSLCRIILGSFFTGQVGALLYSLCGGLSAWTLGAFLYRPLGRGKVWVLSILSALMHNTAQLCCAVLITDTPALWYYLPILLLAALPAGTFTGLAAQAVLDRLD